MNTLKKSNPFNENELIQSTKAEMRYAISKKLGRKSHKEVSERKNEILRELAKKEIENHDYQLKANLVRENIALQKRKELSSGQPVKKESFESLMEWEEETFKIDSTDWKVELRKEQCYNDNIKEIKVKVSPAGDVFEFISGPAKGEQLFVKYENFLNYLAQAKGCTPAEAEMKYLMTRDEFSEKIKQIKASEGGYKAFLEKEIKNHQAGCWNSQMKCFRTGDSWAIWLLNRQFGGDDVGLTSLDFLGYGFSGRLLKEPK